MGHLRAGLSTGTCLVFFVLTGCVSYPDEIRQALQKTYGADFQSYSFRGMPIGNFGVGTIYDGQISGDTNSTTSYGQPQEAWLLAHPNTWYLDSTPARERKRLDNKIFVKGSLGSAQLIEDISTRLSLSAAIPNLSQMLNVGASVSYEKGVRVTLKASEAENREMNWSEFSRAVNAGLMQPYIKDLLKGGAILVASKDVVLKGYTAEIKVDHTVNPELNAKLNDAVGKTIGADSSFKFGVTKKSEGVFEVKAKEPVVAAVMYLRPPKAKATYVLKPAMDVLSTTEINRDSFSNWEAVVIPNKILDPLEVVLADKVRPNM